MYVQHFRLHLKKNAFNVNAKSNIYICPAGNKQVDTKRINTNITPSPLFGCVGRSSWEASSRWNMWFRMWDQWIPAMSFTDVIMDKNNKVHQNRKSWCGTNCATCLKTLRTMYSQWINPPSPGLTSCRSSVWTRSGPIKRLDRWWWKSNTKKKQLHLGKQNKRNIRWSHASVFWTEQSSESRL